MKKQPFLRNAITTLLLLAILGGGSALRLYKFRDIGPFIADEADYNLEAKYIFSLARGICQSIKLKVREARTSEDLWRLEEQRTAVNSQMMGRSPWYARPGQIFIMAAGMTVLGPEPYIGPLISAIAGILTLLIVFFFARSTCGTTAGLLAAAILAFSGIHVTYCRTGLTESLNTLIVIAALWLYTISRGHHGTRARALISITGLLLGAGFIVHYRTALIIALFVLLEILRSRREQNESRADKIKRLIALTGWATIPVLLWELPYYLAVLALHRLEIIPPFLTYFEQLLVHIFFVAHTNLASTAKVFDITNFLTYPYLFWKLEGAAMTALLPAALTLALRERKPTDGPTMALLVLPLLFYSLAQPNARYAVLAAPLAALLAGRLLGRIWESRPAAAAILAAALIFSGLHASSVACGLRSDGYASAEALLRDRGGVKRIATYKTVAQVYGGVRNVAPSWPASSEEIEELYNKGYRYFVVDFVKDGAKKLIERYGLSDPEILEKVERQIALIDLMEENTKPVFILDNPPVTALHNIFEVNHSFRKSLEYLELAQDDETLLNHIRVYDIGEFLAGAPSGAETPF